MSGTGLARAVFHCYPGSQRLLPFFLKWEEMVAESGKAKSTNVPSQLIVKEKSTQHKVPLWSDNEKTLECLGFLSAIVLIF